MIKVLLERRVKREKYDRLLQALRDLRAEALNQPGYVTGETLVSGDKILTVLVIATWLSEEHWKAWLTSQRRIEQNNMIDNLLEEDVKTSVYRIPAGEN